MNHFPNVEESERDRHPSKVELPTGSEFDVRRSAFSVWRLLWRVLDIIIAAVFIYAGTLKVIDPVHFARDIDNYKMLPWPAAVASAFYLPWLEILCGIALLVRRFYQGSLTILTGLTVVFLIASIAAKARGLDISCGCFGHVSQGWSFGSHLLFDFGLLAALVILWWAQAKGLVRNSASGGAS